MIRNMSINDFP